MRRACGFCDLVGKNSLQSIPQNIADVSARIAAAERQAGRPAGAVQIIGVSKRKPSADIQAAYAAGLTNFGENFLQEAIPKIKSLAALPLTWHFIGAIQSNKTRAIAEHFHWVHTLDRAKVAQRLDTQCPSGKRLNTCIQVNIDNDPAKAGVSADAVADLVTVVRGLPKLQLRGLMTMLSIDAEPASSYQRVRALFQELGGDGDERWDTLSMGMSRDFEAAIGAGATLVRIGTEIFGERS